MSPAVAEPEPDGLPTTSIKEQLRNLWVKLDRARTKHLENERFVNEQIGEEGKRYVEEHRQDGGNRDGLKIPVLAAAIWDTIIEENRRERFIAPPITKVQALKRANFPAEEELIAGIVARPVSDTAPGKYPHFVMVTTVDGRNRPQPGQMRRVTVAETEVADYKRFVTNQGSATKPTYTVAYLDSAAALVEGQQLYEKRSAAEGEFGLIAGLKGAADAGWILRQLAATAKLTGFSDNLRAQIEKELKDQNQRRKIADGAATSSQVYVDQLVYELMLGSSLALETLDEQGVKQGLVVVNFDLAESLRNQKVTLGQGSVFMFRDAKEETRYHRLYIGRGFPHELTYALVTRYQELSHDKSLTEEDVRSAWQRILLDLHYVKEEKEAHEVLPRLEWLYQLEADRLEKLAQRIDEAEANGDRKLAFALHKQGQSPLQSITRKRNIQTAIGISAPDGEEASWDELRERLSRKQ
jgi:hypothetical protein